MRLLPLAPLALIAACSQPRDDAAALAALPAVPREGDLVLVDAHQSGDAGTLRLVDLAWGRLADVHVAESASGPRTLVARDFVIGDVAGGDDADQIVETEPLLGRTSVTILHPRGSAGFARALAALERGLVPIAEKSLDPGELPPWTVVPRDAALVARFDDLLDRATIPGALTVALLSEPGAGLPVRVLADPHHGGWADRDGDGTPEFHPTRLIVDLAVDEREARASATPLAASPLGLPAGPADGVANVVLRLATASPSRLANLAGNALDPRAHAGTAAAGNLEVVRAFSSGGPDDLYQGMLADLDRPRVVGRQLPLVTGWTSDPQGGPNDLLVDLVFPSALCAQAATPRDVIVDGSAWSGVVTAASAAPVGTALDDVRVRVLSGSPQPGEVEYLSAYNPATDAGREACFVEFLPAPAVPPARGVAPEVQVHVRFSEALDPATIDGFDGLRITSVAVPDSPDDRVAAVAGPSPLAGPAAYVCVPILPLDHRQGQSEVYHFTVGGALRDPAGNPLATPLALAFRIDPAAASVSTGSHVLTFDSPDEDGDGFPELRGQFLQDLPGGRLLPRPVVRYAAVADRTQPVPGLMTALPQGVQTPLSSLGSKLLASWRPCDVGLGLLDESGYNVDVEGLAWAPSGGSAIADSFTKFEISLAHGRFLPDEALDPTTLLPQFPQSGLVATYAQNLLDPAADPFEIVHPRQRGYLVDPADLFVAGTGTPMMPFPLNRGIPVEQHRYYTWRDTAIDTDGAPNGAGAELAIVAQVTGAGTPGVPYPAGAVPTVGLPLLMEFKCFPDAGALGLNAFDVSIAVNSSSQPNFRAFSTGGVDSSGQIVTIDPDLQLVASGGFDPLSMPPGAPTSGTDNVSYLGQMDLVIRVSRAHGIWIDTGSATTEFAGPLVAPRGPDSQPPGTSVVLAWRGAASVTGALASDAGALDAYGDPRTPASGQVVFFQGDPSWKALTALDGARFVQPRITFVSNAATGATANLSGLAIAFRR